MTQQLAQERNFLLILRAQIDARLALLDQSIGGKTHEGIVTDVAAPADTTATPAVKVATMPASLHQKRSRSSIPASSQPPSPSASSLGSFAEVTDQNPFTTTTTVTTTTSLEIPIQPGEKSLPATIAMPITNARTVGVLKSRFETPPHQQSSCPPRITPSSSLTSGTALFEEKSQPIVQQRTQGQLPNQRRVSLLADRINKQVEPLPQEQQTKQTSEVKLYTCTTPGRLMERPCVACGNGQGHLVFSPSRCEASHSPLLCTPCMGDYATAKLEENSMPACPCNAPQAQLIYKDMRELRACNALSQRTYDLYLSRLREKDVGAVHSNWIWCPCGGCGDVVYGEAGQGKTICRGCNNFLCFSHEVPWHIGRTCTQVDEMVGTEKSREWLKKNSKACPQCGAFKEKSTGCDHMKCVCGHEFFWCCLRAYRDIVAAKQHKKECNYLLKIE